MSKQRILVIGYFGHITNQIDGQTIRTNSIYNLIKERSDSEVIFFDTQSLKFKKLNIFKLLFLIFKANTIFDIAAHGHLKYLFPIIYLICAFFNKKLNFVSIGGWLYIFLKNKPFHKFLLSRVDNIFVQTLNLDLNLRKYNFENIVLLNNFRLFDNNKIDIKFGDIKKIVFMARVHEMKGVDTIFKLSNALQNLGYNDIEIDIYGPIHDEYKNNFIENINNSLVNYGGIVEPFNVYSVLEKYDFMIFPTKYYTEGFPGSILDSYIAGIPVIASNWLNAHEFIVDENTGYIVEFDNPTAFIDKVIWLIQNPEKLGKLKANIIEYRKQYSADAAWSTLLESKAI
ncbi:glycosyltransferase family 4 protein [Acinetobacter johnsonii]|nr:glycosyltransferase family 4 protein [Acinetobacter johnsonii]